jgi:uracil-DNA glycosylase family 4
MIEPHDLIASKMIGYRGKLGIPDNTQCVFGSGPIPPKAVILGGNPDGASVSARFPFMGVAGQLLAGMMTSAGLAFGDFYRTYAIKFQPASSGEGTAAALRAAAWPFLKKELKVIGRQPMERVIGSVTADMPAVPACRLMMVMGMTPALMLFGPDAMKMTSGDSPYVMIGKQQWRAVISLDPGDAVSSGTVKAEMNANFRLLAALINHPAALPAEGLSIPLVPRGHSSLDLPKPEAF